MSQVVSKLAAAFLFCLAVCFSSGELRADWVRITGDVSAGTGQFEILFPITFDVVADGDFQAVIFDEWTTSDGVRVFAPLDGGAANFAFSVNGTSITDSATIVDNLTFTVADVTENDGYVFVGNGVSVVAGDTITLEAGTYSIPASANFNPLLNDFSVRGPMFLTDANGVRLSNVIVIPEPTACCVIYLFGVLALTRRRRR